MTFFIHLNLLLGFLISSILYAKRGIEDISTEHDKDTENEIEDITNTKSKIKELTDKGVIDRVERGLPVSHKDFKDLENIKQEYGSYFDDDSGNTLKEGMEEVSEYLEEELGSLPKNNSSEGLNTPSDDESKKRKTDDQSSSSSADLPIEMPSIFDDMD
jgi:hypothetical protein